MNTAILGISCEINHRSMMEVTCSTGRKSRKNSQLLWRDSLESLRVKVRSPNPSQLNIAVLSITDLIQLAIQK